MERDFERTVTEQREWFSYLRWSRFAIEFDTLREAHDRHLDQIEIDRAEGRHPLARMHRRYARAIRKELYEH